MGRIMDRFAPGRRLEAAWPASAGILEGRRMPEATISLDSHDEELAVFGSRDQYLRQVRDALGVKVLARHGEVRVEGEPERVAQARRGLPGRPVPLLGSGGGHARGGGAPVDVR